MKKKILVVSHDAGGANILFSLIQKYQSNFEWKLSIAGPAKTIFSPLKISKTVEQRTLQQVKQIISSFKPDLVLTGTSGKSNLERNFIKIANENNFKTASFLDHWCNYPSRFGDSRLWKKNLPDFILVGDQWAYKIALKNGFPKNILIPIENPYFGKAIQLGEKLNYKKGSRMEKYSRILVLSEPNSNIQIETLRILRSHFPLLRVRPHPSESISKKSLFQDCSWADIVIGCRTMALFIAFLMKKKTISYQSNPTSFSIFPLCSIKEVNLVSSLIKHINNPEDIEKSSPPKYIYNQNKYSFRKKFLQMI